MTELDRIESYVHGCVDCDLCRTVTNKVFGEGDPSADLMFVGEAPGREEDMAGRPFIGDAGQVLDKALDKLGLPRSSVYICNVLKCRPPGNKIPGRDPVNACMKWLDAQIRLVAPKAIVALGNTAMRMLLDIPMSIGKMRGKVLAGPHDTKVVPTWHPAYLLRQGDNRMRKKAAKEFIADLRDACGIAGIKVGSGD